ncbi:MFS transporter [Saccharothrix sp. BKS2]|uniref:MFS transporter n=1 Tax=Saccharothrix sp. BKS2 TaxID=3064400 RepID=UPI0039E7F7A4
MPAKLNHATVLVLSCTTQFLVLFDTSVITVALPSIQADLGFSPGTLQWAVHSYTLAFAGLLLPGGRLADLYGWRRVFLGGMAVFTAAGLVGGLADSAATLIAARAAQGAGAAVLAPLALTMLTTTFAEGHRRTRALTTMTAVALVGGAAGNLLGGVATEFLTWRSVLLVNVPFGLPLLVLAAVVLAPRGVVATRARLDLPGAVLATAGFSLLTLAATRTAEHGWADPAVTAPLVAGSAALVGFVVVETRYAPVPLVPPRLFALPGIAWGNAAMLLAGASQVPVWYFLTLTMQDVLGFSAAQAGLGFLPHALVMMAVVLVLVPWLMRRVHTRTLIAVGGVIGALGFWWQSRVTPDSDYVEGVLVPAVAISIGGGLVGAPLTRTVTAGIPHADAGAASGVMSTARQFGGAFGLAALIMLTVPPAGAGPVELAASYGAAFRGIALIMLALAVLAAFLPALRDDHPEVAVPALRSGAHDAAGRHDDRHRPPR